MSIVKTCPTCGQEFWARHTERQIYCSRSCAARRGLTAVDCDTRICRQCGREFRRPEGMAVGIWIRRVFCSEACRVHWHQLAQESVCECGAPATTRIYFNNLTGDGRALAGYLPVCQDCHDFMLETDPGCADVPFPRGRDDSPWYVERRPASKVTYGEPTAHLTKGNRPR